MASGEAPALCITAVPIIISGSTGRDGSSTFLIIRTKQRGADEFLRKQRQRLRLSDFFRPTWEDLVGLRVISVNLISLAGPNAQKFHLLVHLFGNGL